VNVLGCLEPHQLKYTTGSSGESGENDEIAVNIANAVGDRDCSTGKNYDLSQQTLEAWDKLRGLDVFLVSSGKARDETG
jgi:hypothetical protein